MDTRVLLAVTAPPALLSFGRFVLGGDLLMFDIDFNASNASTYTCLAIAQTKPASSRAIAVVTTVGDFPARASLRYRRHSRSCAFHAVSRIGLTRPSCRSSCSRLMRAGNR